MYTPRLTEAPLGAEKHPPSLTLLGGGRAIARFTSTAVCDTIKIKIKNKRDKKENPHPPKGMEVCSPLPVLVSHETVIVGDDS